MDGVLVKRENKRRSYKPVKVLDKDGNQKDSKHLRVGELIIGLVEWLRDLI